ncbi:MAG TPA: thioredoxin domain-containing protein [Candidatus Magasanikbacteria bacterium]|nr:thioredoxin domain-containing protein [Candidatus Magasanikbacteria bacterium]
MSEERSIFEALSPKQMFVTGLVGGIMVLCTIGFFVLLGIMLSGGVSAKTTRTPGTVVTDASGNVEGPEKFSQCLDSGKTANIVAADQQLGSTIGVNGTPATFVNGVLVSGAFPYDALKQVIDTTLAGKSVDDLEFLKDQTTGKVVKVTMPELPDAIWLGNEKAKVTVVEFSDFECPYCLRFEPAIKQMITEYGDKIRFTYRHFPLSFHPNAQKAAEAYECAKEQGMAWEMHEKLFGLNSSGQLGINGYKRVATELGLD